MSENLKKDRGLTEKVGNFLFVYYLTIVILLYAACIAWFLCFPLVSICTGELKPRGLFVDENSLLVNSALPGLLKVDSKAHVMNTESDLISGLNVTYYAIDPQFSDKSLESIALVLPYNLKLHDVVQKLIDNLGDKLKTSQWLAKQVIVLPLPTNSTDDLRTSSLVRQWLKLRQSYHASMYLPTNLGLIREAYILDLTQLSGEVSRDGHPRFSSAQLLYSGVNGQLPNMDMISYPLISFKSLDKSWSFSTESHDRMCRSWFTPSVGYSSLLCNVIDSMVNLAVGPTGLHHHFLDANIDAVTLKFSSHGGGRTSGPVKGMDSLLNVIMRLVYISNNLHGRHLAYLICDHLTVISEELHHSFTYYLIMGSQYFVVIILYLSVVLINLLQGLTEYGSVAGVMMLSLLALYLHFACQCTASRLVPAVVTLLSDLVPFCIFMCALSYSKGDVGLKTLLVAFVLHGASKFMTSAKADKSLIIEYTTLILTVLLCSFAWIAAQNFSLALAVYLVALPLCVALLYFTAVSIRSGNGVICSMLEFVSLLVSPVGMFVTCHLMQGSLQTNQEDWIVRRLLYDWREFGSYALPFNLLVASLLSNLAHRVKVHREAQKLV